MLLTVHKHFELVQLCMLRDGAVKFQAQPALWKFSHGHVRQAGLVFYSINWVSGKTLGNFHPDTQCCFILQPRSSIWGDIVQCITYTKTDVSKTVGGQNQQNKVNMINTVQGVFDLELLRYKIISQEKPFKGSTA